MSEFSHVIQQVLAYSAAEMAHFASMEWWLLRNADTAALDRTWCIVFCALLLVISTAIITSGRWADDVDLEVSRVLLSLIGIIVVICAVSTGYCSWARMTYPERYATMDALEYFQERME